MEKLRGVSCDAFERQMKKCVGMKEKPLCSKKLR